MNRSSRRRAIVLQKVSFLLQENAKAVKKVKQKRERKLKALPLSRKQQKLLACWLRNSMNLKWNKIKREKGAKRQLKQKWCRMLDLLILQAPKLGPRSFTVPDHGKRIRSDGCCWFSGTNQNSHLAETAKLISCRS